MTVSSTQNKIQYVGNGSTTLFNFPYSCSQASFITVTRTDTSTGTAVDTVLTSGSDFTVALTGSPAGSTGANITMMVAPVATTQYITISRVVAITQNTSYPENSPFPAKSHEAALDNETYIAQQLNETIGRSPALRPASQATVPVIQDPVANYLLQYDTTGKNIIPVVNSTSAAGAANATAAAASAAAAATSATAAAASAALINPPYLAALITQIFS